MMEGPLTQVARLSFERNREARLTSIEHYRTLLGWRFLVPRDKWPVAEISFAFPRLRA